MSNFEVNNDGLPTVAIIGGGFCGMMSAVRLSQSARGPLRIVVINSGHPFSRGIAFSPYSKKHLLNVAAGKMSAFSEAPDHFVEWILNHNYFLGLTDKNLIAGSYMPRSLYGDYLEDIWMEAMEGRPSHVQIEIINGYATSISSEGNSFLLRVGERKIPGDYVVLATGNSLPAKPELNTEAFFSSPDYFGNPWAIDSVSKLSGFNQDILIIGNGLTMVDTVLGLVERGFSRSIYSVSPNGFAILPHRHNGVNYHKMVEEFRHLNKPFRLAEIVALFKKHVKLVRKLGVSAEPVIDSLRPWTQEIWKALNDDERSVFLRRLRHLWGVARHRLPVNVHDVIQKLRIENRLKIHAGRLVGFDKQDGLIRARFYNKRTHKEETILVERVINCTGPATNVDQGDNLLLKNLLAAGLLKKDKLDLGIEVNPETLNVIDKSDCERNNLFALGNLVKGMLWESTAVPELRVQIDKVAKSIQRQVQLRNEKAPNVSMP